MRWLGTREGWQKAQVSGGARAYSNAHPQWVYVANTNSLVRFPYWNGDLKARGPAETVIGELPGYACLHGGGPLDTRRSLFAG